MGCTRTYFGPLLHLHIYVGATVRLTKAGNAEAGDDFPTPTNDSVQDGFRKQLKGKKIEIFDYLLDGKGRTRKEVQEACDCMHLQDRSFNNLFSKLRGGLAILEDYKEGGKSLVKLSDSVFPFGRPSNDEDSDSV